MLTYIQGDLFTSPAKVLVNTVNTQGVMGKGIALTFKKAYPDMFKKYQHFCENDMLKIGNLWLYKSPNKWILNFPTKTSWRKKSEYAYIEMGLEKFKTTYQEKGITSIAFPKLGCGNGGLDWNIVKEIMERYLSQLPIDIYIYEKESNDKKEYEDLIQIKKWLNSNIKDLPYSEFSEDLDMISHYRTNSDPQINEDNLIEFWHRLKDNDFITAEDNPFDSPAAYQFISAYAIRLPYIKTCQIRKDKSAFAEALQLVPPIENHNQEKQKL